MGTLKIFVVFVVAVTVFGFFRVVGGWDETLSFNKEDFLENLLEAPDLKKSDEFKTLGYLNDGILIEMKLDLTNHKRSILTQAAEIILKYYPQDPPKDKQKDLDKMSEMVQRSSYLEDSIWLIIKIRRLHDQRMRDNILAEKPSNLQ